MLQLVVITHDEEFVSELGRATNDGGGSSSRNQVRDLDRTHQPAVMMTECLQDACVCLHVLMRTTLLLAVH